MGPLIFWIGCGVVAAIVAPSRGRMVGNWIVLGPLFGPLALITIALLPSIKRDPNAPSPETHVRCPDCRELVLADARKCKHCGVTLVPELPPAAPINTAPSRAELLGRKIGRLFSSKK